MTDNEKKLVIALVRMVHQYLDQHGDQVDSRSMSAGEQAIEVLAGFGLMEAVNTRFGRWTEAGNKLLEEIGLRHPEPTNYPAGIALVAKSEPKK
jgi:hypothetical protein